MLIIETLPLLRQQIRRLRMEGKRVALVPTMGNLHDGLMQLVEEAKARADVVVVSIFVNPMQFDRPEDLARYPRTLQEDCEKLNKRKVDLVVVVSIFVNPMQFDRPEDLARYPRTLQEDCEKLNKRKVDLVFAPSVK